MVKKSPAIAGDIRDEDSIPGSGRSPGGEHGHPLQYSCPCAVPCVSVVSPEHENDQDPICISLVHILKTQSLT